MLRARSDTGLPDIVIVRGRGARHKSASDSHPPCGRRDPPHHVVCVGEFVGATSFAGRQ